VNRRRALAALLGAAVLTPGGAAAQDDAERRIRRQLRAQGFRIVERSRTYSDSHAIAIHVPEDTGPRPDDAADRGGIGTAITPEAPERPTEAKTKIAETPRKTPAKGVWKPR